MSTSQKHHADGHRQRLRERFLRAGLDGLLDYEAMELLLTYAVPRRDMKPIAKELLEAYGSIEKLLDASSTELLEHHGIGASGTTLILLLRQLCAKYLEQKARDADLIDSPEKAANFARMKIGGCHKEIFMVLYLNSRNHLIEHQQFIGTVDRAAVYPREIVEFSLRVGATAVILIHNHPSGLCTPSDSDLLTTSQVRDALRTVQIRLADHLIVTPNECLSFRFHNLLK